MSVGGGGDDVEDGAIQLKSVDRVDRIKSVGTDKSESDNTPYTSEISRQRSKRTSQKRGSGLL